MRIGESLLARGPRRTRVNGLRQIDVDIINEILDEENLLGEAYRSTMDPESPLDFSPLDRVNPPWVMGAQRAHPSMLPRLQTDMPHLPRHHLGHCPLPPSSCYSYEHELDHAFSRLTLETPSRESAIASTFPPASFTAANSNLGFTEDDFQALRYTLESIQSPLYRPASPDVEDERLSDIIMSETSWIASASSEDSVDSFNHFLDDASSYNSVAIHHYLNHPDLFRYADSGDFLEESSTYPPPNSHVSEGSSSFDSCPPSLPSSQLVMDSSYDTDRDLVHDAEMTDTTDSESSDVGGVSLMNYPEAGESIFMDIDLSDDGGVPLDTAYSTRMGGSPCIVVIQGDDWEDDGPRYEWEDVI